MAAAETSRHMELSPSPIAEAFGLGAPTGPLVAISSGPFLNNPPRLEREQ
jgi:hypothetical protein